MTLKTKAKPKSKARKIPVTPKEKRAAKTVKKATTKKPITVMAETRRNRKLDGKARGRPPKGCAFKDGKLVPGRDAAKVKAIYRMYRRNNSVTLTAKAFKLAHATAHYCLTNPMYVVGHVIPKGEYLEVQKLLQRKTR